MTVRRLATDGAMDGALLLIEGATLGAGDARPTVEVLLAADEGRVGTAAALLGFVDSFPGAGVNLFGPACALLIKAAALRTDVVAEPLAVRS